VSNALLALKWRRREGRKLAIGHVSERDWLDFLIDGRSLRDLLEGVASEAHPGRYPERMKLDYIGCLGGWLRVTEAHDRLRRQLLLEERSGLDTERYQLYICPECGDIGCGAITAVIEQPGDSFVWRDFAMYEKDWQFDDDDPLFDLSDCESIGPFRFDKEQYREALLNPPPKPES
jgi:hypothetical protein